MLADDLNREIAKLENGIKWANELASDNDADGNPDRAELCRDYAQQLKKRKATLEEMLRREEAPRAQPVGPCVELKAHDGVTWRV